MKNILTLLAICLAFCGSTANAQSDGYLTRTNLSRYIKLNTPYYFSATLMNNGPSNLTSCLLVYSVYDSIIQQKNIVTNLPDGGYSTTVDFVNSFVLTSLGTHTMKLWIQNTAPSDTNQANDTLTINMICVPELVSRKLLVEKFTGTWCPACPGGIERMMDIEAITPNMILVDVHRSDNLSNLDATALNSQYAYIHTPSALVDRKDWGQQHLNTNYAWEQNIATRAGHKTPINLTMTRSYNSSTRQITVNLTATVLNDLPGNFRLNAWVIEDSVLGNAANGMSQQNAANTVVGSMFYGAGNPINPFYHMNVARKLMAGIAGDSSAIPANPLAGTYSTTLTYTLPANYNEDHIRIVGFAMSHEADITDREMLDAEEMHLTQTVGLFDAQQSLDFAGLSLYPNPSNGSFTVALQSPSTQPAQLSIVNQLGQTVWSQPVSLLTGANELDVDFLTLPAGAYHVRVNSATTSVSQIMIVR